MRRNGHWRLSAALSLLLGLPGAGSAVATTWSMLVLPTRSGSLTPGTKKLLPPASA